MPGFHGDQQIAGPDWRPGGCGRAVAVQVDAPGARDLAGDFIGKGGSVRLQPKRRRVNVMEAGSGLRVWASTNVPPAHEDQSPHLGPVDSLQAAKGPEPVPQEREIVPTPSLFPAIASSHPTQVDRRPWRRAWNVGPHWARRYRLGFHTHVVARGGRVPG